MRKHLLAGLVGAAIAALTSTYLIAQVTGVFTSAVNGQETWEVGLGGPQGPSTFVTTNFIRGGTAQSVLASVTGSFTIGVACGNCTQTGTPLQTVLALSGGNLLVNAQPSAATITMPANPILDGAIVGVCNVTGAAWVTNVVTLAANSGQTLAQAATLTALAAGTCAREQWNQANATWYRVQ